MDDRIVLTRVNSSIVYTLLEAGLALDPAPLVTSERCAWKSLGEVVDEDQPHLDPTWLDFTTSNGW